MNFEYLAQDEYDILDEFKAIDKTKFKDPIEITIKITVERTRYNSVKNRRRTPLPQFIKDIFKPCK